ncbi:MAG TPA: anthranilate phosphoribosyltransferase [Acidimicrobiales bacterium]
MAAAPADGGSASPAPGSFDALGSWPGVLTRLLSGASLSAGEAEVVLGQVLSGEATPAQIAGLAVALRSKGESVAEMTGFVRAMVAHAVPLPLPAGIDVVDTCGTGGDRLKSINVSTIASLVVAASGAKVCKHGGRASSSAVGAADVLEALGAVADLGPAGVARSIDEVGLGFCFAPRFHPAMRFAGPVRRELGIPTVFNFLGPLANPARAKFQVVGVSDASMADKMLGVLAANGTRRAMVVHGDDGLDELSTTGPSTVHELIRTPEPDASGGGGDPTGDGTVSVSVYRIDPSDLGLARASLDDLRGGDASVNADAIRRVVAGDPSPHRDIALLNAAAALVVIGRSSDLAAGITLASSLVDSGRAAGVLDDFVRVTNEASVAEQESQPGS